MTTPTAEAPTKSDAVSSNALAALIHPAPRIPRSPQTRSVHRWPREKQETRKADSLAALGAKGRLAAYRSRQLSRAECWEWARRFPDEVPIVNGELEWIGLGLADLD